MFLITSFQLSVLSTLAVILFLTANVTGKDVKLRTKLVENNLDCNDPSNIQNTQFGASVTSVGDLDKDGISDLAVGAPAWDRTGPSQNGAVYILLLEASPGAAAKVKTEGCARIEGQAAAGYNDKFFGYSLAAPGDLDADGVPDLIVGAPGYDSSRGAVYVLFLKAGATGIGVKSYRRIEGSTYGYTHQYSYFGFSLACVDYGPGRAPILSSGLVMVAVGIPRPGGQTGSEKGEVRILGMIKCHENGGSNCGKVGMTDMNGDGVIDTHDAATISPGTSVDSGDYFGTSLAGIGDLDGDGIPDLAVGARDDDDGSTEAGAVSRAKISRDQLSLHLPAGYPRERDWFGTSVTALGDMDGDGVPDLAIGSAGWDSGTQISNKGSGAVYLFKMRADGGVAGLLQELSRDKGGITDGSDPDSEAGFGTSIAPIGDLDRDGIVDIFVGASASSFPPTKSIERPNEPNAWILHLDTDCVAGTEAAGVWNASAALPSSCRPCENGKVSDAGGTCACPTGTVELPSAGSCINACAAGEYYDTKTNNCAKCPSGSIGSLDSVLFSEKACSSCSPGTYNPSSGNTKCKNCTAGTYQPNYRSMSCLACPGGRYNEQRGQTSILQCKNCPINTYSANVNGSAKCADCELGRHTGGALGSSFCGLCEAGSVRRTGDDSCSECTGGRYSADNRQSCEQCGPGKYVNSQRSGCDSCASGKYLEIQGASSASQCVSCAKGRFQTATGSKSQANCVQCPHGRYSTNLGSSNSSDCKKCSSGKYGTQMGASDESSCFLCEQGRYQTETGSQTCLGCPSGTYGIMRESSSLETGCANCSIGKYSSATGLASEDLCNRCPVGRTGRAPGLTSAAACHPVPAGSFASTENGQEMKCEPGTYQDEEGQSSCKRCPTGKHGLAVDIPNDVAIACENCPAGRYSGAKGIPNAEGCVPCPAGTLGSTSGAESVSECQECPPGKFNDGTDRSKCQECRIGTFSNVSKSIFCENCPRGRHGRVAMPVGESRTSVDSACIFCEPGRYSNFEAATSCTLCGVGKEGFSRGGTEEASSCTPCSPGSYKGENADTCRPCHPGSYAQSSGMKSCIRAPEGSYSLNGSTTYHQCPETRFPNSTSKVHCDGKELSIDEGFYCIVNCSWMNASSIIALCANEIACKAPVITYNATTQDFDYKPVCAEGYRGLLCSQCDASAQYGLAGTGSGTLCAKCPSPQMNFLLILGFSILSTALVVYVVRRKSKKNKSSLTRIILTYLQFHSYASFLRTDWPSSVMSMYHAEETVTSTNPEWVSLDCFIHRIFSISPEDSSMLLQVQLVTIWVPFAVFFLIFLLFLGLHVRRTVVEGKDFFDKAAVHKTRTEFSKTTLIVEWLMWSTILKNALSLYKARTFGKGDNALRYLAIDLSVPFYGDAHTRAVFVNIIPIVLHVIGFPLYLGYVLYKYRLNLQRNRSSSAVRSSISAKLEGHYEVYGFLVAGYREGVEWWEFTILLRRLCIIASIVFLHDYKQTQAATAFLVLLLAFYAHLYYRPYDLASDRDQDGHASGRDSHRIKKELLERARVSERLERYSLGVLLLTILSSFYFMGNELPRDGIESNFIGWSVILINILYLAFFALEYTNAKVLRPEGAVRKAVEGLRLSERFHSLRLDSVFGDSSRASSSSTGSMSGGSASSGMAGLELVPTTRTKSKAKKAAAGDARPPSDRERDSSFNTFVNPNARVELGATRAAERAKLPPGWVEATDPNSGALYYYNKMKGESTWTRPT